MTVAELEALLALLPADMSVVVSAGNGCRHVTVVDKAPSRRRSPGWVEAGMAAGFGPGLALVDDRHPAQLVLRGDNAPMWWQEFGCDVDFTVTGRWPRTTRAAVQSPVEGNRDATLRSEQKLGAGRPARRRPRAEEPDSVTQEVFDRG